MGALVPDVPHLQNELAAELLLHVEIPGLRIRRLLNPVDAVDVEWRLRRSGSKNRHSYVEWNRRGRNDGESTGCPDGVL